MIIMHVHDIEFCKMQDLSTNAGVVSVKVGGSSPPRVKTFSVSKTSTSSRERPFMSRE